MKAIESTKLKAFGLLLTGLASCVSSSMTKEDQHGIQNMWVADAIRRTELNNAIIVQRAIFPYHFVAETSELNGLGDRDVQVLAGHFEKHRGRLSIRRGGASEELHQARVQAVVDALVENGMGREQIEVHDGAPGGTGMASGQLLLALEESRTADAAPQPLVVIGGSE